MRKYFVSAVFIALLAFSVFLFVGRADIDSILKENREPAAIPALSPESVLNGTFEDGFGEYVNDNTAYRGKLMALANKIGAFYGYTPEGLGQIISTTSDIGTGEAQNSRLVIYDNSIMEVFDASPETETKYADTLNSIRKSIPKNIDMYSMLVPTRLEFCDPLYSSVQDSQKEAIDLVYSRLDDTITTVDVYSRLFNAFPTEDNLYFMTDHHWTADGAYYGYESFSFAGGKAPKSKNIYEYKKNGTFLGSLYLKAKSALRHQPEDACYYYDTASGGNISIKMRAEDGVTEYGIGAPVFQTRAPCGPPAIHTNSSAAIIRLWRSPTMMIPMARRS